MHGEERSAAVGDVLFRVGDVRYPFIAAVDRDELRSLLFEDGPLAGLLLSAFMARREALQLQGVGMEVVGPRSSEPTQQIVEFARRNRLPFTWRDPEHSDDPAVAALIDGLDPGEVPLVRLPGGMELRNPYGGEVSRALGIGLELSRVRRSISL